MTSRKQRNLREKEAPTGFEPVYEALQAYWAYGSELSETETACSGHPRTVLTNYRNYPFRRRAYAHRTRTPYPLAPALRSPKLKCETAVAATSRFDRWGEFQRVVAPSTVVFANLLPKISVRAGASPHDRFAPALAIDVAPVTSRD